MLSVLMIYASYFAMKAEINFGIVSSCLSVGAPVNCVLGYLFWKEKLSKIIILGTAIILCGVVWVALAKGKVLSSEDTKYMSEEDRMYFKICSIACAVFSAFLGSIRI
jgi:drug/metabolite transporter (DMT)-like permease